MFIHFLKRFREKLRHLLIGHLTFEHLRIEKELEAIKLSIGRHESRAVRTSTYPNIRDAEFKVFSQFGEDGIIQYLVNKVTIKNKIFVELGVGNYYESNTRFLLMNDNWHGKIINCGTEHIDFLNSENGKDIRYRYDIEAVSCFLHKDNINEVIRGLKIPKDIGLLSIDLDGVDYWIWEAMGTVNPEIVIVEYNSHFGYDFAITVPYKKTFDRTKEHYSNLYFGSSLPALCLLGKKKGYQFVGSNSAGLNAFFVRKDMAKNLPNLTAKDGYVANRYRESKDISGKLTYIGDHKERLQIIASKKVFDVQRKQIFTIRSLFKLTR
ncbi:MAG: hypothetical protein Q8Q49_06475 [bacterium]|nr:hypothetical protein [bacterium]